MARVVVETWETRTVKRNGKLYKFSRAFEPETSSYRAGEEMVIYPARTELYASVWTGQDWRTLHRLFIEG